MFTAIQLHEKNALPMYFQCIYLQCVVGLFVFEWNFKRSLPLINCERKEIVKFFWSRWRDCPKRRPEAPTRKMMRVSFAGQYVSAVGKLQATLYLNGRLDLDVKVADFFRLGKYNKMGGKHFWSRSLVGNQTILVCCATILYWRIKKDTLS